MGEILIAAGTDDPKKLADAKAKADDIEARLHAGRHADRIVPGAALCQANQLLAASPVSAVGRTDAKTAGRPDRAGDGI